jgi:hypothetical protein
MKELNFYTNLVYYLILELIHLSIDTQTTLHRIKHVLLSLCGYEIVMKGIPDKYVKEINDIMWSFI